MDQEIGQSNLEAAHDFEERFHRTWGQLWEDARMFPTTEHAFNHDLAAIMDDERPFRCVRCGKGLTYSELYFSAVMMNRDALTSVTCYPCRKREDAKRFIHAWPTAKEAA